MMFFKRKVPAEDYGRDLADGFWLTTILLLHGEANDALTLLSVDGDEEEEQDETSGQLRWRFRVRAGELEPSHIIELESEWTLFDIFLFARQIRLHVESATAAEKATAMFFWAMACELSVYYGRLSHTSPQLAGYYASCWTKSIPKEVAQYAEAWSLVVVCQEISQLIRERYDYYSEVVSAFNPVRLEDPGNHDLPNLSIRILECLCGTGTPSVMGIVFVGGYFLEMTRIFEQFFHASMRKVKVVV